MKRARAPLGLLGACLAAALVAGACGAGGGTASLVEQVTPGATITLSPPTTTTVPATSAPTTVTAGRRTTTTVPVGSVDLAAVIADIQRFWGEQLPALYNKQYTPLAADRIVAMSRGQQGPTCDRQRINYRVVADNAFATQCDEGPLIVYDADRLIPGLINRYGIVGPAVVLAHEWGHLAQFQSGMRLDVATILLEQQADCFAGSWLAVAGKRLGGALADPASLDRQIGALLEFRDSPGGDALASDAHGSGFDRVRAFQEGFENGGAFCAKYPTNPPKITEVPFTQADALNNGNLPFDQIVSLATKDLNLFYGSLVKGFAPITVLTGLTGTQTATCNGTKVGAADVVMKWCAKESAVVYDSDLVHQFHDSIGDNATATLLGLAWAEAARERTGLPAAVTGDEAAQNQQACLTGGWFNSIITSTDTTRQISLSAGDLDEAVQVFVQFGLDGGLGKPGRVFSVVAQLRQGVIGGAAGCKLGK